MTQILILVLLIIPIIWGKDLWRMERKKYTCIYYIIHKYLYSDQYDKQNIYALAQQD